MTTKLPVMIPKIIQSVIGSMEVQNPDEILGTFFSINYQPGRMIQILDSLHVLDGSSVEYKSLKYPLFGMVLPVRENRTVAGYYATVRIDRIIIAALTSSADGSDLVLDKYGVNGTYTTILYPLYYEFLRRLARHPEVITMEPDSFVHTKMDNPCQQPIGQGLSDYVDTIEILGLELTLNQIKTC